MKISLCSRWMRKQECAVRHVHRSAQWGLKVNGVEQTLYLFLFSTIWPAVRLRLRMWISLRCNPKNSHGQTCFCGRMCALSIAMTKQFIKMKRKTLPLKLMSFFGERMKRWNWLIRRGDCGRQSGSSTNGQRRSGRSLPGSTCQRVLGRATGHQMAPEDGALVCEFVGMNGLAGCSSCGSL